RRATPRPSRRPGRRRRPARRHAAPPRRPRAGRARRSRSETAEPGVVRHPAAALRLHLDRLERAVRAGAAAPDDHAAAPQLRASPDVGRERPYTPDELVGGLREVELAVGGSNLLRVRDPLLGLRPEALRQRVEEAGGDTGGPFVDGTRV